MSTRCPHEEERKPLDGRLARREGHTPPQRIPHPPSRPLLPIEDAAAGLLKKIPAQAGTVAALCQAWASLLPRDHQNHYALVQLAEAAGNISPHQLTHFTIQQLVARWKQTLTRNTASNRRHALCRVLRQLEASTGVTGLVQAVPRLPGPRPRQRIATPDDLARLTAHAVPWQRVWLTLTLSLALRQSEVRVLAPIHYDAERRVLRIPQKKTRDVKDLPVTDELAEVLEAAPHSDDPTVSYLERYRGRPVTAHSLYQAWHKLKRRAGVQLDLWLHDLRRTTAVTLYDLSKDLRAVQALLGHQQLLSTTTYLAHRDPQKLRPLLEALQRPLPTEVKQ